ncbi:hypothetical protein CEXT_500761 [Caerostris extrusa]|uniref:Uncharacterized protein n=1 Tax=Caerostris extrusa TaxID=172846 RepID=A0AAV4X4Q5_CAEEX|nr:hypothetical protein CEXT_500761 [Caerostris extrusa]
MIAFIPSTYFNRLVMIYQNRFLKFPFPYIDDPLKDFPNSPSYRFHRPPLYLSCSKGVYGHPTCITKKIPPHHFILTPPPQPTGRLQQFPKLALLPISIVPHPSIYRVPKGVRASPPALQKIPLHHFILNSPDPLNQLKDYSSIYTFDAYCRRTLIKGIEGRGVAPLPNLEQFMINWQSVRRETELPSRRICIPVAPPPPTPSAKRYCGGGGYVLNNGWANVLFSGIEYHP